MEHATARQGARAAFGALALAPALGVAAWVLVGPAPSAFADSQPYELYCPGTPVGNIVLNDVVTTGTITTSGSSITLTNYQTKLSLPSGIVSAAAALGNTAISGTAKTTIDATGATPATLASPSLSFSVPIPTPVPSSGMALTLPTPAASLGPFTASGGSVSLAQDKSASLSLTVSGNALNLTCTAYANNAVATSGITSSTPPGSPISPVIATGSASGGGGGGAAPTTTVAPATAAAGSNATSATGSLAFTGVGPGLDVLALLGVGGLLAAGALIAVHGLRHAIAGNGFLARRRRRSD